MVSSTNGSGTLGVRLTPYPKINSLWIGGRSLRPDTTNLLEEI